MTQVRGWACVLVAALSTGCYAEIAGGAYKVSHSGGTMLSAGDGLDETGYSVGLNVGMHFDFWKTTRIAAGYGSDMGVVGASSGGKATVSATGLGVRLDQKLLALGDKHVGAVTGFFQKGTGSAKYTPMGGTEMDAAGGTSMELFAGGTLGLYDQVDPAYANWAYHLSGGLAYMSNESEGLGEVSMMGVQGRLTISWSPKTVPALFVGGSASSSAATTGNITSFTVDMPGSDPVVNGFAGAMKNAGCEVSLLDATRVGGFCGGVKMVVIQEGSQLLVGCENVSDSVCRGTFSGVLDTVK